MAIIPFSAVPISSEDKVLSNNDSKKTQKAKLSTWEVTLHSGETKKIEVFYIYHRTGFLGGPNYLCAYIDDDIFSTEKNIDKFHSLNIDVKLKNIFDESGKINDLVFNKTFPLLQQKYGSIINDSKDNEQMEQQEEASSESDSPVNLSSNSKKHSFSVLNMDSEELSDSDDDKEIPLIPQNAPTDTQNYNEKFKKDATTQISEKFSNITSQAIKARCQNCAERLIKPALLIGVAVAAYFVYPYIQNN